MAASHVAYPPNVTEMERELDDPSEQSVLLESNATGPLKRTKHADVHRGLKERHIQMISLAGMIGVRATNRLSVH